jgi:hypothetical protein
VGGGLSHRWSVGFPYDPATGAVGTTETITEREIIYPSPWIAGRSATDSVVLHTQPCPIVG